MSAPSVTQDREASWIAVREYFGSEPYKAQLRYLNAERALCVAQLVSADTEIEVRRLQGAIRLLDKIIAGMTAPVNEPEE